MVGAFPNDHIVQAICKDINKISNHQLTIQEFRHAP
jgi:hypothetical protein